VGLANELLKNIELEIESITLIPSEGGRYEITVNDKLVYSKLQTGRHADPGEVMGLIAELLQGTA
jgi:selenoprotein W-related protein